MADKFSTVDEYIRSFPEDVQKVLEEMRRRIHKAVPGSGEKISYQIPTITLDGKYVVYFAGWKQHVSLYPVPAGDEAFEKKIAPYRAAKGTLKFPLGKPVPYDLVERVAKLLARQRP
ncbi:MAG TPA: hypothetical protein DGT23_22160 [Micromonosporaceae bacterium]|nr:hypothetical protein [Micromonosporaceae bacterium]